MSVVPTSTLIRFLNFDYKFIGLIFLYWFVFFSATIFIPRFKALKPEKSNNRQVIFWSVFLSLIVVGISGVYTGFRFHFTLFDVYDLREEALNYDIPLIIGYLHGAAGSLLPMLLVFYLAKKNNTAVILLALVILLNFGIGGHKSVFFSLFLAMIGFYYFRYSKIILAYWGFLAINIFAIIEFAINKTYVMSTLMIYRVLLVPSQLNYYYYDYFKNAELDYFRQGFLRWFGFHSPYDQNIAFMIGGTYFNDDSIRANNGLFADAYFNCGIIGVIIFPVILVVIFKLIDALSSGIDERIMFAPIFVTSISLISASFTTVLLTYGILLMMFVLYSIPKKI